MVIAGHEYLWAITGLWNSAIIQQDYILLIRKKILYATC